MTVLDIRYNDEAPIETIVFADSDSGAFVQAYVLKQGDHRQAQAVKIMDENNEYVFLSSAEHGLNLVKAIEKAVQLGWLK